MVWALKKLLYYINKSKFIAFINYKAIVDAFKD